jgi:hypothetical protein
MYIYSMSDMFQLITTFRGIIILEKKLFGSY